MSGERSIVVALLIAFTVASAVSFLAFEAKNALVFGAFCFTFAVGLSLQTKR